jgi:hypothetical protein
MSFEKFVFLRNVFHLDYQTYWCKIIPFKIILHILIFVEILFPTKYSLLVLLTSERGVMRPFIPSSYQEFMSSVFLIHLARSFISAIELISMKHFLVLMFSILLFALLYNTYLFIIV